MILYFSGTGNSQFIAEILNEKLNDEIINIENNLNDIKTYQSDKPYIFVLPTYAYRIPRIIEEFIKQNTFSNNQNVYIVLTCGASTGNAYKYAKSLIEDKKMKFRGLSSIVMPENYIALFPIPDNDKALKIIEKGKEDALKLADNIITQKDFPIMKDTIIGELLSNQVNEIFFRYIVNDKGFKINDDCIHCLKCVEICPLNNISKELVFLGHCTHCMRCICSCPKEAIVYKNRTQKKNHYLLKKVIK